MKSRLIVTALMMVSAAGAAELKWETVQAWDDYVGTVRERMQQRLRSDHAFLWIDEHPELARQARSGETVVLPVEPHTPRHVPSGLIHHWIGVTFVPGASLADILSVVRDYSRYREFYHPNVVDSRSVRQSDSEDRFSMVLVNKSTAGVTAIDSDYQSTYFPVDARRWYSVSHTTRVQEVGNYGQPEEHRMPEGAGSGFIWRLASVTRFEERDGGVYIEIEALALSRDVPGAVRWLVDPIIRRVSRNSLQVSLRQTRSAVNYPELQVDRSSPSPRPAASTAASFRTTIR